MYQADKKHIDPEVRSELFEQCRKQCSSSVSSVYDKTKLDEVFRGNERKLLDEALKEDYYLRLTKWIENVIEKKDMNLLEEGTKLSEDIELLNLSNGEREFLRKEILSIYLALQANSFSLIDVNKLAYLKEKIQLNNSQSLNQDVKWINWADPIDKV